MTADPDPDSSPTSRTRRQKLVARFETAPPPRFAVSSRSSTSRAFSSSWSPRSSSSSSSSARRRAFDARDARRARRRATTVRLSRATRGRARRAARTSTTSRRAMGTRDDVTRDPWDSCMSHDSSKRCPGHANGIRFVNPRRARSQRATSTERRRATTAREVVSTARRDDRERGASCVRDYIRDCIRCIRWR